TIGALEGTLEAALFRSIRTVVWTRYTPTQEVQHWVVRSARSNGLTDPSGVDIHYRWLHSLCMAAGNYVAFIG
ncbi:MAG: hypothetical protein WBZ57_25225, partial [Pseudomonas graminis]